MRERVEPVGGNCAPAAARESIRALESWMPRRSPEISSPSVSVRSPVDGHAPLRKAPHARGATTGGDEWSLLLSDDVELSEGFYVYIRHFLSKQSPSSAADKPRADQAGKADMKCHKVSHSTSAGLDREVSLKDLEAAFPRPEPRCIWA